MLLLLFVSTESAVAVARGALSFTSLIMAFVVVVIMHIHNQSRVCERSNHASCSFVVLSQPVEINHVTFNGRIEMTMPYVIFIPHLINEAGWYLRLLPMMVNESGESPNAKKREENSRQ